MTLLIKTEMPGLSGFFGYARERYLTKLSKDSGKPKPWTNDPILRQYRFCNVHREDDTVTQWVRQNITFENYGQSLVGAMVIARWFNRVETLKQIKQSVEFPDIKLDLFSSWAESFAELLNWTPYMQSRLHGVKPLVTGAYMIKTPAGMNKLNGLVWSISKVLDHAHELQDRFIESKSLQKSCAILQEYPYLGPFMAYEVITDLRHTPVLSGATDINTWANPGPGATRGICRVLGVELGTISRSSRKDVEEMQYIMQEILAYSKEDKNWPQHWPGWEMREVEHTLCEYDKYERARLGQGTPKQKYNDLDINLEQ
jgi:hypothetical protein